MAESNDPSSVVADLERALHGTGNLVVGVRQDQWTDGTPCPDWDVRALVNHLVYGTRTFTGILLGDKPPPQSEIRTMRDRDQLGDDPVAAYRGSADKLVEALRQPGVLTRSFPSPLGSIPGAAIGQLRITETLVHGWDLAKPPANRRRSRTNWPGRRSSSPSVGYRPAPPAPPSRSDPNGQRRSPRRPSTGWPRTWAARWGPVDPGPDSR